MPCNNYKNRPLIDYNMIYQRLFIIIISLGLLSSCDTFDPKASIPSYVQIDSVQIQINDTTEGTSNQQITDIWFSVNGKTIGTFEIPTTFPVLDKGECTIFAQAGIVKSGIHDFREAYPFFDAYQDTIILTEGVKKKITPIFQYKSATKFWVEDFENTNNIKLYPQDTISYLTQIQDPDNDTNHIGKILIPSDKKGFQLITKIPIELKTKPIYMEIEYKCDETFGIGLRVHQTSSSSDEDPFTIIKPKGEWNKLYLNLAEQMYLTSGKDYDIYLFFSSDEGKTATFYIDNIKILTFDE